MSALICRTRWPSRWVSPRARSSWELLDAGLDGENLVLQFGHLAVGKSPLRPALLLLAARRRLGRLRGRRRTGHGCCCGGGGFACQLEMIGVVVAVDDAHPAVLQDEQVIGHVIDEIAVVADHEHSAVEGGHGPLQGITGPKIEVVGGLVEHQEVGLRGSQPGQGHAARSPPLRLPTGCN